MKIRIRIKTNSLCYPILHAKKSVPTT